MCPGFNSGFRILTKQQPNVKLQQECLRERGVKGAFSLFPTTTVRSDNDVQSSIGLIKMKI